MLAKKASLWSEAVTDTRKDVLPLTADLIRAELAEAILEYFAQRHLGGGGDVPRWALEQQFLENPIFAVGTLRFHGQSHCLVSLDKDVRDYLLRAIRAR
jgi:hypothetical protein